MAGFARVGDPIQGGPHCHGHPHGPKPSPGLICKGSVKVLIEGMPAARQGDQGYSAQCCGGIGAIVLLRSQAKVLIEGRPAATLGTPTLHCGIGPGAIQKASTKVLIP